MKKLICVLGMHRSGTSMVTHLIKEMGVFIGARDELEEGTLYNKDGHFEFKQVVDIHDNILRHYNRSWYDTTPFQIDLNEGYIKDCKEKLKRIVGNLLGNAEYIGLKDPRMCLMFPLWDEIFSELNLEVCYIVICRKPIEVAMSLKTRDGFPIEYGEKLWCYYNHEIINNLSMKKIFLTYYDSVLYDESQIGRIYEFIFDKPYQQQILLEKIVNRQYKHEKSDEDDHKKEKKTINLYATLLEHAQGALKEEDIQDLSGRWRFTYDRFSDRILYRQENDYDLELLNNLEYIFDAQVIIYGAGKRGKIVLEQLCNTGVMPRAFCDIAANKLEGTIQGFPVLNLNELERMAKEDELLLVIAIENMDIADNAREILNKFLHIKIVSYYTALKAAYLCRQKKKNTGIESTLKWLSKWYMEQGERVEMLHKAIGAPVVVYQNGKVGSNTIMHSMQNVQIEGAHLHRIRFENDVVRYVLCNESEYHELAKRISFSNEKEFVGKYIECFKNQKGLKIISLVREPISVDISTVFQWFGTDMLDQYITDKSENFNSIMLELIIKIKNRMFRWFEEELGYVLGINVYDYPFDRENGYVHIKKDNMEILILQLEKLSKLENVIGEFIGSKEFKIRNYNEASAKQYREIYKKFLEEIRLPKDYVDFYYKGNVSMNYFYSLETQEKFLEKWKQKIDNSEK